MVGLAKYETEPMVERQNNISCTIFVCLCLCFTLHKFETYYVYCVPSGMV